MAIHLDTGIKKAILLFLIVFITWQAIYAVALIFPSLYDHWLISYLIVLAVIVCFFALDKQKISDLGLRKNISWKSSIIVGVIFAIIYNVYWVLLGTPILSAGPVRIVSHGIFSISYNILFAITVGVIEETTFRGYILRNLSNTYSDMEAIAYSSVLFGLYHLSLVSALTSTTSAFDTFAYWTLYVLAAVLIGIFLDYFYIYTQKSIIGTMTYHSLSIYIESLIPFTLAASALIGHLFTTSIYVLFIPLMILIFRKQKQTENINFQN
jgi:membrane protease YdiL (CAAX protease family)